MNTIPLWALLVGIDNYRHPTLMTLRGAVNDVEAMQLFLVSHHGVDPQRQICILRNEEATRAAILQAFQEFLIENEQIAHGDQILFYFSGHGSRMPDQSGAEPDGYNETIVAHDSRLEGIFDIPDKTLAALLEQLAGLKGHNITVILDCCHSGSGTRMVPGPGSPAQRSVPTDDRSPPADLDAAIRRVGQSWAIQRQRQGKAHYPYVLLAACRDRQSAYEYRAKSGEGSGVWYGTLTYFLLAALQQLGPQTTYADLHERVAAQVNAVYAQQMPQCEGYSARSVFGGMHIARDPFITVQQVERDQVVLGAGLAHGLRPGTELALYPPTVVTRAELQPMAPLATVRVSAVTATSAHAQIVAGEAAAIPRFARGVVTRQVYAGLRQLVHLRAESGEAHETEIALLRQAFQQAPPNGQPSPYLEELTDPDETADLYVVAAAGQLRIHAANGDLLVQEAITRPGEASRLLLYALENIARYRALLLLSNQEPGSRLTGRVHMSISRFVADRQGPRAVALPTGNSGDTVLSYNPARPERNGYVVEVINESDRDIFVHLFILNPDYSIFRLYPNIGQQEALRPQGKLPCGLSAAEERLEVYLPDGIDASRDYLKLIVTTAAADLRMIEQQGLRVPPPPLSPPRSGATALEALLVTLWFGAGSRYARPAQGPPGEDWTTLELPFVVRRELGTDGLE